MKTQAHFGPEGKISRRNVAAVKPVIPTRRFVHFAAVAVRAPPQSMPTFAGILLKVKIGTDSMEDTWLALLR